MGWDGAITSVALRSHTDGSLAVPQMLPGYLSTSSDGLVGVEGVAMTVALRAQTDATLLSYLLHFHMHWMPRQRIFSCTCTRAGCYVIESLLHLQEHWKCYVIGAFLAIAHALDATSKDSSSCTCTYTGCHVLRSSVAFTHTGCYVIESSLVKTIC